MDKSGLLLPLYYVKKQTRNRLLSEKSLIILIILTSVFSLYFIFKNLPSNTHSDDLRNVFIPKLNINDKNLIHKDDVVHVKFHENKQVPKNDIEVEQLSDLEPILVDTAVLAKRNFVKNMTLHAWNGYKKYAWGHNELRPLSRRGHSAGIFGGGAAHYLGATIVDALDTLYIMGFKEEYKIGKDWIIKNLDFNVNAEFSVFEVNIRFVGGLLSLFALTGEKEFLQKAEDIAKLFLPVFDSPTGIPYSLFNPGTKSKKNYGWAAGSCSILAELGTISLEFSYLSDLTGNPIYKEKVKKIQETLGKVQENGMYYNYINPSSGKWCNRDATLGALADSFYEYLLKLWIYGNKKDDKLLSVYLEAMEAAKNKLIGKSPGGLTFAGEYQGGRLAYKMGHLACFSAGMFALASMQIDSLSVSQRKSFKNLAAGITHTCHESYVRTKTHIGPESFHFNTGNEAVATNENEKYYILRPEVIEAYFYMWRMTKDNKYREWAWDAAQSIEKYCKTDSGYSGIRNVYDSDPSKDDVQQSFYFAETLKYLYLIFSDDDVLSFDKYVMNTEAHPFLINKSL